MDCAEMQAAIDAINATLPGLQVAANTAQATADASDATATAAEALAMTDRNQANLDDAALATAMSNLNSATNMISMYQSMMQMQGC